MKSSHLKFHFPWTERKPLLSDKVFFVPDYYAQHRSFSFPEWIFLFGNDHPVNIEYCSGHGHWIIEKAKEYPEQNWIAVEKRFDRVRKIHAKMQHQNISNLFIVSGEALTFTHHYLQENSILNIYINFPDPWPKSRHAKHRLMNDSFIQELVRISKDQSEVTFVSDDEKYLQTTLKLFLNHPFFLPKFENPYYLTEFPNYGPSVFDSFFRAHGMKIHYTQFIRKHGCGFNKI